jgi:hypothetical protein
VKKLPVTPGAVCLVRSKRPEFNGHYVTAIKSVKAGERVVLLGRERAVNTRGVPNTWLCEGSVPVLIDGVLLYAGRTLCAEEILWPIENPDDDAVDEMVRLMREKDALLLKGWVKEIEESGAK